jgi:hypothetical protein
MGRNATTDRAQHQAVIDDRRARVASFKCQGMSLRETIVALTKAKCINPDTKKPWSIRTIHEDLEALTALWRENSLRDITLVKAEELAKLDRLEREAWVAWDRSVGHHQTRTTKTGRVDRDGLVISEPEITVKADTLDGDPRFMAIILDCQKRRAALMGLDMPAKIAQTTADGEDLFDQDARAALHAKLLG